MNEANVRALAAIIEQIKDAASDEYVWHETDDLARLLAAEGVLVMAPGVLKNSDLDWLESFRYPTYAEKRAFLTLIAQGRAQYPLPDDMLERIAKGETP